MYIETYQDLGFIFLTTSLACAQVSGEFYSVGDNRETVNTSTSPHISDQLAQSLATVFIIICVFPSSRPLPCINKKFMNSDGHQMAWTVRSARVYRIQRSKSIKLNTDSQVVPRQLEEKYISYHSPTIKNDITRSDACKRCRNSVKLSNVGRQKVPCTS